MPTNGQLLRIVVVLAIASAVVTGVVFVRGVFGSDAGRTALAATQGLERRVERLEAARAAEQGRVLALREELARQLERLERLQTAIGPPAGEVGDLLRELRDGATRLRALADALMPGRDG